MELQKMVQTDPNKDAVTWTRSWPEGSSEGQGAAAVPGQRRRPSYRRAWGQAVMAWRAAGMQPPAGDTKWGRAKKWELPHPNPNTQARKPSSRGRQRESLWGNTETWMQYAARCSPHPPTAGPCNPRKRNRAAKKMQGCLRVAARKAGGI